MKNTLDFYAQPVNFTYHGFYLYPSFCGGVFSLILECLLISYLIFLLIDLSGRKEPEVLKCNLYSNFPDEIEILEDPNLEIPNRESPSIPSNKQNHQTYWYIAIAFKANSSNVYNPNNFSLQAQEIFHSENGGIPSRTNLTFVKCSKFGNGFVNESYFNKLGLFNAYCLKSNYNLKGLYGFPNSKWLEITIRKKFENVNDSMQFEFYYQSKSLNYENWKKDSFVSNLEERYWDFLEDYEKVTHLTIGMDKAKVNDYFLPRFIVRKYASVYGLTIKEWNEEIKSTNKITDINSNVVFKLTISLSRKTNLTEREFKDFISILALIGGLSGVVFLIGFLFVFSIRNFRMNENMMNDCYFILDPKNQLQEFDQFLKIHYKRLHSCLKGKSIKEEKLLKQDNWTSLERFFNIDKIETLLNIPSNLSKDSKIDEYFDPKNYKVNGVNSKNYLVLKFCYLMSRYKSLNDFSFSFCEMVHYFFFYICCCRRRKSLFTFKSPHKEYSNDENLITEYDNKCMRNDSEGKVLITSNRNVKKNKVQENIQTEDTKLTTEGEVKEDSNEERKKELEWTKSEEKFAVYKGASKKIGIDFDLINILKTIEGFNLFAQILFGKKQIEVFNSIIKPAIKEKTNDDNKSNDKSIKIEKESDIEYNYLCQLYEILRKLSKEPKKIKEYQKKLLMITGRTEEEIENFMNSEENNDIMVI